MYSHCTFSHVRSHESVCVCANEFHLITTTIHNGIAKLFVPIQATACRVFDLCSFLWSQRALVNEHYSDVQLCLLTMIQTHTHAHTYLLLPHCWGERTAYLWQSAQHNIKSWIHRAPWHRASPHCFAVAVVSETLHHRVVGMECCAFRGWLCVCETNIRRFETADAL